MPVRPDLADLCLESFWSAQGVARLKADGSTGAWARDLMRASKHEDVAPLRTVLREIADDGLQGVGPLQRFESDAADAVPVEQYVRASRFGRAQLQNSPGVAYVVTLVSALGWAHSLGTRLPGQVDGMPNWGWATIPGALAESALKLGDVSAAQDLVNAAYDMLMSAKYQRHPALVDALTDYRRLAGKAARRQEQAVENLADDLARGDLRPHLWALMWTLGFVPESEQLRARREPPSKWMVNSLVRLSLERLPHDPLVQYIWLEMKDQPSVRLRNSPFFYRINARYDQYLPDVYSPTPPSAAYAKTLTAWLDGSLDPVAAGNYLEVVEQIREFEDVRRSSVGTSDWSLYLRTVSLAYLVAQEYDLFASDAPAAALYETWRSLLGQATRMRSRHHLNPQRPDLAGTLSFPLFRVVEQGLGRDSAELGMEAAQVVLDLERNRAATMTFSLAVNPPAVRDVATDQLANLLTEERRLISFLRSAYFLVQYDFLPQHLRLYETQEDLTYTRSILNSHVGIREYQDVEGLLTAVQSQIEAAAGVHSGSRTTPAAGVTAIVRALSQHAG